MQSVDAVLRKVPDVARGNIKGVKGLSSGSKYAEPIEKGALRSKHEIYVYKDGTTRVDITNAPLTHFRPSNIHVDLTALHALGYDIDKDGNPLVDPEQIRSIVQAMIGHDPSPSAGATTAPSPTPKAAPATVDVLNLMIASTDGTTPPVDVNLLGLEITTSDITAKLTATTGDGQILGNLVYNVSHLLDPGGTLNLLGILGQLAL